LIRFEKAISYLLFFMDKGDTFDPNHIFLEIQFPAKSGLDLARRIKSQHPDIVIAVLTSYDLPEYQIAAEESGVEHLVPKDQWTGVDMIDLVQVVLPDQHIDGPKIRQKGKHSHESSL
jgi:DNA-binding NarL/FixJ family response regulator